MRAGLRAGIEVGRYGGQLYALKNNIKIFLLSTRLVNLIHFNRRGVERFTRA